MGADPSQRTFFKISGGNRLPRYLISFNDGDMNIPVEDFSAVDEVAHKVMREAITAGVWIVGGGFEGYSPRVVGVDSSVKDGPLRVPVLLLHRSK